MQNPSDHPDHQLVIESLFKKYINSKQPPLYLMKHHSKH